MSLGKFVWKIGKKFMSLGKFTPNVRKVWGETKKSPHLILVGKLGKLGQIRKVHLEDQENKESSLGRLGKFIQKIRKIRKNFPPY